MQQCTSFTKFHSKCRLACFNLFASIYEQETRAIRLYTQTIVWGLWGETHHVYAVCHLTKHT